MLDHSHRSWISNLEGIGFLKGSREPAFELANVPRSRAQCRLGKLPQAAEQALGSAPHDQYMVSPCDDRGADDKMR
jgi:hypothetical protein